MSDLFVSVLYTYPIKSCTGIQVEEGKITATGFEHDRQFMLIDDEGTFLSQRQIPEMTLIAPSIGENALILSAPGMPNIDVPLNPTRDSSKILKGTVHNNDAWGQLVSEEADEWLTEFLPRYKKNERVRLLHTASHLPRFIKEMYRKCGGSNKEDYRANIGLARHGASSISSSYPPGRNHI